VLRRRFDEVRHQDPRAAAGDLQILGCRQRHSEVPVVVLGVGPHDGLRNEPGRVVEQRRPRVEVHEEAARHAVADPREDIDGRAGRGIDRREVMSLALGDWVTAGHSILITGPTGAGKSWLACALAQYACRRGYSAVYQRVPRLQEELRIRHGSGAFGKWLIQLAKTDVLLLDDWGMGAIDSTTRSDLLEIIDDRAANKATIITSQLPVEHWHAWIGDATIADAILDRIMQRNHRFTLTGDSLRAERPKTTKKEKNIDLS